VENLVIDLVYTWCDGSDPDLKQKQEKYLIPEQKNFDAPKFRDLGELRYSLRSVSKFGKIFDKIYIVHDDCQIPTWLNVNYPKIVLVPHTSIIPDKYLPTFNSQVIDMYLHKIDALSEVFVYSNDDCFFGEEVKLSDFYDGEIKIRLSTKIIQSVYPSTFPPYHHSLANFKRAFEEKFGSHVLRTTSHTASVMRKEYISKYWDAFSKENESISNYKYRSNHGFSFPVASLNYFHHILGCDVEPISKVLKETNVIFNLEDDQLTCKKFNCINNGIPSIIKKFYEFHFPEKSEFEL
jgi:hypothetical protein